MRDLVRAGARLLFGFLQPAHGLSNSGDEDLDDLESHLGVMLHRRLELVASKKHAVALFRGHHVDHVWLTVKQRHITDAVTGTKHLEEPRSTMNFHRSFDDHQESVISDALLGYLVALAEGATHRLFSQRFENLIIEPSEHRYAR